jgi:hypothetical protein
MEDATWSEIQKGICGCVARRSRKLGGKTSIRANTRKECEVVAWRSRKLDGKTPQEGNMRLCGLALSQIKIKNSTWSEMQKGI